MCGRRGLYDARVRVPTERRWRVLGASAGAFLALCVGPAQAADELSGADKLRALYSTEFRFTKDGVPIVPVAVGEGLSSATIDLGTGGRLLPEGEGGPEIRLDDVWRVQASNTVPARLRFWSVVWRAPSAETRAAAAELAAWRARGEGARTFEQGAVFAIAGEVVDRREVLVAVGPRATFDEAERALETLKKKAPLTSRGVYTELVERPRGDIEAVSAKTGARVRNEGVLWFVPAAEGQVRVRGQAAGREDVVGAYAGRVYVTLDRAGKLAIVNAVPEDRLLAGLLPAEMFPSAPDEALRAQAVAARGQLLTKIGARHFGDPFRLCARTHCQVYAGAGHETPRATAAVKATRGEVLFTADGSDLVDTVYSANCGGYTENNENVWPDLRPAATLRGLSDAVDPREAVAPGSSAEALQMFLANPPRSWSGIAKMGAGERFRWSVTRAPDEMARLLAPLQIGKLRAIEVTERGVSGRALAVTVVGTSKRETVRGELRIRQTFGGLRSSLFVVAVDDAGGATFRGAGFGHGVGLCQTGSVGMAEAGKSYRDILRHYYRGSVLRKLW